MLVGLPQRRYHRQFDKVSVQARVLSVSRFCIHCIRISSLLCDFMDSSACIASCRLRDPPTAAISAPIGRLDILLTYLLATPKSDAPHEEQGENVHLWPELD